MYKLPVNQIQVYRRLEEDVQNLRKDIIKLLSMIQELIQINQMLAQSKMNKLNHLVFSLQIKVKEAHTVIDMFTTIKNPPQIKVQLICHIQNLKPSLKTTHLLAQRDKSLSRN